ncbi:hypothetical protein FRC17_000829 [Serendipita sp. 399]|nr:hypothetical protein FRC17_000829 [Serendipita sp. 399]
MPIDVSHFLPSGIDHTMSTKYPPTTASSEELTPLSPRLDHPSHKIRKENHLKVGFLIAAPILGYISIAIATSTLLIFVLHHRHFRTSNTDDVFRLENNRILFLPLSGLRQSDVTTLVSLASTLTRFLGSICCGITCWRAAYILLEREGLTLADLDGLVSFPFLRPWPWSAYRILISFIALLFLSSELYSPILNGSVSWKTAMSPASSRGALTILRDTKGLRYVSPTTTDAKERLVYQAVAYMSMASGSRGSSQNESPNSELWAIERGTSDLPVNSTLANITIPFFAIDSFEWVTDPENTLDATVLNAMHNVLNYTYPFNPLLTSTAGYVALLPNKSQEAVLLDRDNRRLPRTAANGTYYAAINLARSLDEGYCEGRRTGQFFEYVPSDVKAYPLLSNGTIPVTCLAFARVSLRAGVGICTECRLASSRVLVDATLAAVLLDATEVVDHLEGGKDGEGKEGGRGRGRNISNMSVLLAEEKSTRVRLKGGGDGENGESHPHFRLVPDVP